ncbi:MAG: peptidase [bacterium]|nr:peptidase [bacterium]
MISLILILSILAFACGKKEETPTTETPQTTQEETKEKKMSVIKDYQKIEAVKNQIGKLAPVEIAYDDSGLSEKEKKALELIVKAAKYMDQIFLKQVYHKNDAIAEKLKTEGNADYDVLNQYFIINFGPFDRLEHHTPFINLDEKKPKGANYYPVDMTKKEFEDHIKAHPEEEKNFTSEFTLIRRKEGKLVAIPYSEAYKEHLEPAAKLMKEAALLVENPSLKKYLNSRADAFASNDYYQSDIDWVLLKDHKIEMVIGPYEVYEDTLFNYKAAFEAFITLVDQEESKKLDVIAKHLDDMEKNLPIDDKYKNFTRGKESPIAIVNEVYTSGDTKAGVQTTAFNLPNDERVRESTGSKKVMLKNIAKAKFEKCWIPIVKEVLSKEDLPLVSFDSYFNHVLMHEVSHGLGPGNFEKDGKKTSVGKELKDLYSLIEEAKADILGLYNLKYMIDKGVFPKELEKNIYVSYLGGIFRSVRFGITEAHGGANAIQLNYIVEKGGFAFDEKNGRYGIVKDKIEAAVKQLSHDVLMIEALGDYAKAKEMKEKYCKVTPELQRALDSVKHVPIDIKPIYAIEK